MLSPWTAPFTVRVWHLWASHEPGAFGVLVVGWKEHALVLELGIPPRWQPRVRRWHFWPYADWAR